MQFSTDLPAGPKEVREHIQSGKRLGIPRRKAKVVSIAAKCLHCGLVLHDKSNADTTRTDSLYCDAACKKAAYRLRHSEDGKEQTRQKERDAFRKHFIAGYKAFVTCCDCGEDDPSALDFDHLEPQKKSFTIAGGSGVSMTRLLAEIEKCAVRCKEDHKIRHVTLQMAA
jgi:hypothetical protein